jgi:HemY protein
VEEFALPSPIRNLRLAPFSSVLTIAVFLVALWLTLKILSFAFAFIRFVNGDETAISRHFDRNRERKGFQALTDGMMALASGDGPQAVAFATKADKFLKRPELTNPLGGAGCRACRGLPQGRCRIQALAVG